MAKGFIVPFPKQGNLGITKNHRGIILTSIAAKIYNDLLLNHIELETEKILKKKKKEKKN